MRRLFVALVAATVLSLSSLAALASEPVGRCPASFEGPLTAEEIVSAYPPPPGIPDPTEALLALDRNSDEHLCVRQHADGVRIIVIDNRVRA
jgi:hypothetical protein